MHTGIRGCLALLMLSASPLAAAGVYCDTPAANSCYYYASIMPEYDMCTPGSNEVQVASCPAANLLGTCTFNSTFTVVTRYYTGNGITTADAPTFASICTGPGFTWSASSGGPTATTPLPAPPASQSSYAASNGTLPEAAVQVNATGTYGSANLQVTLDVAKALAARSSRAAAYNVYIVAIVPGSLVGSATPVLYVKPQTPANWQPLEWPIAHFMANVAQSAINNQVIVEILDKMNITALSGVEIYVGYGITDQEMLAANRFRGVYKVQ